jgi:predicted enzyme related to lactoylglutathione lyase
LSWSASLSRYSTIDNRPTAARSDEILRGQTRAQRRFASGTCSLGFSVPNLNNTYEELRKRGVNFVMPPTDQPKEGIRLAVCLDPDGLTLSFAEPLAREATAP